MDLQGIKAIDGEEEIAITNVWKSKKNITIIVC
jgi:hypothetical protein